MASPEFRKGSHLVDRSLKSASEATFIRRAAMTPLLKAHGEGRHGQATKKVAVAPYERGTRRIVWNNWKQRRRFPKDAS